MPGMVLPRKRCYRTEVSEQPGGSPFGPVLRSDPLARTKLGECSQHADECARQMRVEPCRDLVIGSRKGIDQGQGYGILGENQCVNHKSNPRFNPEIGLVNSRYWR
jgi:hypothetical protein